MQIGVATQQQWGGAAASTPWEIQGLSFTQQNEMQRAQQGAGEMQEQMAFPPMPMFAQDQAGQQNQAWLANPVTPPLEPTAAWSPAEHAEQTMAWAPTGQPEQAMPFAPQEQVMSFFPQGASNTRPDWRTARPTNSGSSSRLGFTIAGLCVGAGGLILIFVFILSLSLPPLATKQAVQNTAPTANTGAKTPIAGKPTPTQPAASPTPTFPGQQYIDQAQMASSVNTKTAEPLQPATDFKVKQQIFVTFMLHPAQTGGEVCLLWYLNQQQFSHYSFAVNAVPQPGYSYTFAGTTGTGYVEIYWASNASCSDKVLAQQVDFTVSA